MPDIGSLSDFFFRRKSTLDALTRIGSTQDLVVYCGAGVSIDRTGMDWTSLIRAVFNSSRANRTRLSKQIGAVSYLLDELKDPQQLASIVLQAFKTPEQDENEFLGSKLKDALYEPGGWNLGSPSRISPPWPLCSPAAAAASTS